MSELQERQHNRLVILCAAALLFAAIAAWQLISDVSRAEGHAAKIFLIFSIALVASAIVAMMCYSYQDFRTICRGEMFDEVSGLPSRTTFIRSVEREVEKLQAGEALAVVFADIRRFKSLNHSFGYQAGDSIIASVAGRLRQIAGPDLLLARLEGDRFAFQLKGITSHGEVQELVGALQRAMVPPFTVTGKSIYVDLTIGSAHVTEADNVAGTELLRRAEFALIEAKAGDGKFHVSYSDGSAATARRVSTMETGLRETLEADEIECYFQPLVDSRFDRIVAVEALARWTHPQFGRVSPIDFIGMAESLGLVSKMGFNILRRSCMEIKPLGDIRLAVNISPRHFMAPCFVSDVKSILDETGFPAHRLELEITENVLLTRNEAAAAVIEEVRALGISVALDDFGTGYSGLSYLNRFQLDRIKIDASFVRELENSISAQSMVATIIHLARDRGLEITIEGVETTGQVLFLSRFGLIWYQGFLFARPMPIADLIKCGDGVLFAGAGSASSPTWLLDLLPDQRAVA